MPPLMRYHTSAVIIKAIKVYIDAYPSIEMPITGVAPPKHGATPAAVEPTEAPKKKTPGFEAVFAIAGLLAVAYLVLRQRE